MKPTGKSGAAIATAAFALALSSATLVGTANIAAAEDGKVGCMGVNSCKGKSECKTADNACKGQNGCKGKGVVSMTKEECESAGGTVAEG